MRHLAALALVAVAATACGDSSTATARSVVTEVPNPFLPLPALTTTVTESAVKLSWTADGPVRGFAVFLDQETPVHLNGSARAHSFERLRPGSEHFVQVQALDGTRFSRPVGASVNLLRPPPEAVAQHSTVPASTALPTQPPVSATAAQPVRAQERVRTPASKSATRTAPAARVPVPTPTPEPVPPRKTPASPLPAPAPPTATPTQQPEPRFELRTLSLTVAPGGAVAMPGAEAVAAGCRPYNFAQGDAVALVASSGREVGHAVLGPCERVVVSSIPGVGALTGVRFRLDLPVKVGDEQDWLLRIGSFTWPLDAARLKQADWSVTVSTEGRRVSYPLPLPPSNPTPGGGECFNMPGIC